MAGVMTHRDAEKESQHTTYEVMHCIFSEESWALRFPCERAQ